MSPSSRFRTWMAILCAASLTACSGVVRDDGNANGDEAALAPVGPGDLAEVIQESDDGQDSACGDGACDPGEACDTCSQDCGACAPGCGNGVCSPNESCQSCPTDCGACPPCGDGACDPGETCGSCSQDCGLCPGCGNGVCGPNESCSSCPGDCGACPCAHATCTVGAPLEESCDPCVAQICAVDSFCCEHSWDSICVSEVASVCGTPCPASCGDGQCTAGEACDTCAQDCGACPVCGDGFCDWTEACDTCVGDCGACPVCGDGLCDWTESCQSCAGDCGACPVCGDGTCDPTESCQSCAGDCGACVCHDTCLTGPPLDASCGTCEAQICAVDSFCCTASWDAICVSEVGTICGTPCGATCGDGQCQQGESCSTCAADCGACSVCGDGVCDWTEACDTCAQDCGACAACGDGVCDPGETCGTCAGDCGACPACPGNTLVGPLPQTVTGSTAGLVNGLTTTCAYSNAAEVTYSFTAPADGSYEFNTFGSAYDTILVVRDGDCQGAGLACNDDTAGLRSKVSVDLTAGQTVVVQVDGFGTQSGAFTLNACEGACAPACGDGTCNPNESCSTCSQDCGACSVCGDGWCEQGESCSSCSSDCGACPVCGDAVCDPTESCDTCSGDCGVCPLCPATDLGSAVPQTVTGSTAGLVNALPSPCAYSNSPELTYSFTAPADGTYEFNTTGSAFDTILHAHDGTCQGAALACNDDHAGLQSQIFVPLTAGQTVILVVDGFGTQSGAFTLNVL